MSSYGSLIKEAEDALLVYEDVYPDENLIRRMLQALKEAYPEPRPKYPHNDSRHTPSYDCVECWD